jgi:hypothetical protein
MGATSNAMKGRRQAPNILNVEGESSADASVACLDPAMNPITSPRSSRPHLEKHSRRLLIAQVQGSWGVETSSLVTERVRQWALLDLRAGEGVYGGATMRTHRRSVQHLEGWHGGYALDLYSRGAGFESRPGHRLPRYYFRGLPQSREASATVAVPQFRHDRYLPNPFQFITHQSLRRSTLYSLQPNSAVQLDTQKSNYSLAYVP